MYHANDQQSHGRFSKRLQVMGVALFAMGVISQPVDTRASRLAPCLRECRCQPRALQPPIAGHGKYQGSGIGNDVSLLSRLSLEFQRRQPNSASM